VVQVIELELATGIPMLYMYKEDAGFQRRGSPLSPDTVGVFALSEASHTRGNAKRTYTVLIEESTIADSSCNRSWISAMLIHAIHCWYSTALCE